MNGCYEFNTLSSPELHHVKAASQTTMVAGQSSAAQNAASSGLAMGGVGNRGLLLGPHITSIESFRGAPGMRVSTDLLIFVGYFHNCCSYVHGYVTAVLSGRQ